MASIIDVFVATINMFAQLAVLVLAMLCFDDMWIKSALSCKFEVLFRYSLKPLKLVL